MIGIGVIGYGYWGPNLVRNFALASDGRRVVAVCDNSADRRGHRRTSLYPAVHTYDDVEEMLADPDVDAVAIATPVTTHFDAGDAGARTPASTCSSRSRSPPRWPRPRSWWPRPTDRGLTLMVDHTFIYTSAVRKIHELIHRRHARRAVLLRLGQGQPRPVPERRQRDVGPRRARPVDHGLPARTHTDLGRGDGRVPTSPGQPENMAYLTCLFDDNLIAHFHVNWLAPVKVRQTLICGSEKMVVFDDIDMSEKVKVYDKGIIVGANADKVYQRHVGYRTGDMWAPRLDNRGARRRGRPLPRLHQHRRDARSDGQAGLRVVRILEAATESLSNHGAPVDI